ncbi:MAG: hypothetical protein ABJJ53_13465 [Sulfitobacter sp.]
MAYILTAIMTGGVSALLCALTGGSLSEIFWNYVLFGHLGIVTLALAVLASTAYDRIGTGTSAVS